MYQSVLYSLQAYLPIHMLEAVMSEEKNGSYKGLAEARWRANKKYNDRFVEIKVHVPPQRSVPSLKTTQKRWVKVPLPWSVEQSLKPWNANRNQIPKRKNPVTYGYISTHHRMIFSLMSYLRCVIFYMSIFATRLPICMFFHYFLHISNGLNLV